MKRYTTYSKKKREKIVADIPKDNVKLQVLWKKALFNYYQSLKTTRKKRLEYNDEQRKYRNKIMDYALEDYHSKDKRNTERNNLIGEAFSEFWDFFGFWLKEVFGGNAKWNEMENYFHKTLNEFPEELEKRVNKHNKI